jgi:uncharacterized protein YjbI with pentapeptide repeats
MMSVAVLRRLRYLLIALLGLGLVLLLLWAVVVVPPWLIDTSQIPDPAQRLDEVNGLRTNLLGVLAGLTVIAGAAVGALNFRETQRQNRAIQEQNRAVLELQRRGQVTERFTRAIDQLGQQGPERLDVRIGAVYALEQIARDSAELHWPIMEVLTAYLREHARARPDVEESADTEKRLPADHQAIATVIGRRLHERDPAGQRPDLHETSLPGVLWDEAALSGADLAGCNLARRAHLEGAILAGANLNEAYLFRANLKEANLGFTHMVDSDLSEAHLEGAFFTEAHLEKAGLYDAHLERAGFVGAFFEEAVLEGAHLDVADLRLAHGLTMEQLQSAASWASAVLPDELASQLARPVRAVEGGSEARPSS